MNFKTLICDKGTNDVSIGRILLWITFIIICVNWIVLFLNKLTNDVPESLLFVFVSLLSYNVFQKGKEVLTINTKNKEITTQNKES